MADEIIQGYQTDKPDDSAGAVSRRLFAGLGAAAGATALMAALPGGSASAAAPGGFALPRPEVLGATNPALTYLPLDAFAFFTDSTLAGQDRFHEDLTGVQPLQKPARISAVLSLPVGSVIRQLNIAYQGTPTLEIWKRSLTTPVPYTTVFQQKVANQGGGAQAQTFDLASPITIEAGATYAVRVLCEIAQSTFGVTVGYLPPTQSFIPFTGPTPRVLDTRATGGKLNASEERTIDLGFAGVRGAVLNLTVTETEGSGFVAVFPANLAYAGTSSINWSAPDQNIANGVITATGPNASIKIRGGANRTHVVIDRIGWMI